VTKVEILLAHVSHRYKNDVAHSSGRDGPKKVFKSDFFSGKFMIVICEFFFTTDSSYPKEQNIFLVDQMYG
jgi:hypothetical protein